MNNTALQTRKYAPLWNKYRPAILKMMLDAANEPQKYKLMQHEVVAMDEKKKRGFGFTLQISGRRTTNNIKASEIAQDLFSMLQTSPKASELMTANSYEIVMDNQFVLHVNQIAPLNTETTDQTNK